MMVMTRVSENMAFPCGTETSQQEESVYDRKEKAVLLFCFVFLGEAWVLLGRFTWSLLHFNNNEQICVWTKLCQKEKAQSCV